MSVWYILRKLKPITEKRWEKSYKEMCTPCAVGKHPGCSFSISPFRRKDMRLIYLCFVHCFDIFQVHPEFLAFFSFFAVHLQDSVMSLFQLLEQKKHHTKTFRQRTTTTVKITSLAFTGQSGMGRVKESSYFIKIQVRQGEKMCRAVTFRYWRRHETWQVNENVQLWAPLLMEINRWKPKHIYLIPCLQITKQHTVPF